MGRGAASPGRARRRLPDVHGRGRPLRPARRTLDLTTLLHGRCNLGRLWRRSQTARPRRARGEPAMTDVVQQVETPGGEVTVGGTVEPGFEGVRDAFVANFAEHGEVGAGFSLVSTDGRSSTCGAAWPTPTTGSAVHRGHPPARLLVDQGRDGAVRQPAGPAGRARRRRPGRHLLARVRCGRQGRHPGPLAAVPQGRARLHRRPHRARRPAGLGPGGRGAGRA